jgi:hypothetical protein
VPDDETLAARSLKAFRLRGLGLDPDVLEAALAHSGRRMRDACGRLFGGAFDVRPATTDEKRSPCSYCDFRGVCRKAPVTPATLVRTLPPASAGGPRTARSRFAAALSATGGTP